MTDRQFAILENIATLVCSCLAAYFVSPWCFLLLINLNSSTSKDKC